MRIEINPRSLLNLQHICEVLYKLHPFVLDRLIQIERTVGNVIGKVDLDNPSLEEREFLSRNYEEEIESITPNKVETLNIIPMEVNIPINESKYNYIIKCIKKINEENELNELNDKSGLLKKIQKLKEDKNAYKFDNLRTYIQLDTDEYIPMKISVEVEDPVIGRKVRELIEALEKTRAPEQFYLNKKEEDEDAYFAEGYGLTMNEEQKTKLYDFLDKKDVEGLKELLRKENLYPKSIFDIKD